MTRYLELTLGGWLLAGFAFGCSADGSREIQRETRTGTLEVRLTDAPTDDVEAVFITFSQVDVTFNDDRPKVTLLGEPRTINLLDLQDDASTSLGIVSVPPGEIDQIRLVVDDASIVVDGVESALKVPSGQQSGLKLDVDATAEVGESVLIMLDFDAKESVVARGNGTFLLKPVISVEVIEDIIVSNTGPEAEGTGAHSVLDEPILPDPSEPSFNGGTFPTTPESTTSAGPTAEQHVRDLVSRCDAVFRGRIMSATSSWTSVSAGAGETINIIATTATVEVDDPIMGSPATTVTVRSFGGTVGSQTVRVSSQPQLATGEDALFFVSDSGGGVFQPVGFADAKLPMNSETVTCLGETMSYLEMRELIVDSIP